ncbi:MAG: precorrin-8X methylmutase [Pseudomonadota bacterium]
MQANKPSPNKFSSNNATEQLTIAGRKIEHASFAIVDQEVGSHNYTQEQWNIVRRMIHATADFEFNGLAQFHPQAIAAGIHAIKHGKAIIADVEMITVGLSKPRLKHFGLSTYHFISDDDVIDKAKQEETTRAVQAMRKAAQQGLIDGAIIAIGNAPTALLEIIRLIKEENFKPGLIIGMPVGFVSAAESKHELSQLEDIPWIITQERKGGTTLVVSAIHALFAVAETK